MRKPFFTGLPIAGSLAWLIATIMNLKALLLRTSLAAVFTTSTQAARLGDPAAALVIKAWINGSPVDVRDGKNIYVVEFWATWCPPCLTSIPHLTELQKKFKGKGVVIVGVSDETPDKVKPFVEKQAEKMDYVVALDDGRKTSEGYMKAFGQGGIPTAFIVGRDSKVLWVGHPMDGLEDALQQVVEGRYDLAAAIKKDEHRANLREYQQAAMKGDDRAAELGNKLLASAAESPDALCDLAFTIVATPAPSRDFALADRALARAAAQGADKAKVKSIRAISRFEAGQQEEGLKLAKEAVEESTNPADQARFKNYVNVMERRIKAAAETPAKP
jgi:thiol-disulfide isomerase/thioredoxin